MQETAENGRFAAVKQVSGYWSVVDQKTDTVHMKDESFAVCDNVAFALTAKDWRGECGDVARGIQRGLHECRGCGRYALDGIQCARCERACELAAERSKMQG